MTSTTDRVEPHELTLEQFAARTSVVALANHGRKWDVRFADTYSSFSDAATQQEAIVDAHRGAVNNALYFNTPDASDFGPKPSMPPAEVLALYPDVVARFPELNLAPGQQASLF
ncbi:hypothetical protein [Stutzerimonas stutzeri]|uniref:hypothetical protein n=1 Tax=Stutzerimonas stutzeri TaxID=316 RepID=UPI0015E37277|nr:hypothetical protein [Stutzerimonas stutzeri]MBA1280431.1 hypothetical protein [Stutzerimonas stutzeri]